MQLVHTRTTRMAEQNHQTLNHIWGLGVPALGWDSWSLRRPRASMEGSGRSLCLPSSWLCWYLDPGSQARRGHCFCYFRAYSLAHFRRICAIWGFFTGWFLYWRICSSSIIIKQRKTNEKPVAYWIQLFTMWDAGRKDREQAILTRKWQEMGTSVLWRMNSFLQTTRCN